MPHNLQELCRCRIELVMYSHVLKESTGLQVAGTRESSFKTLRPICLFPFLVLPLCISSAQETLSLAVDTCLWLNTSFRPEDVSRVFYFSSSHRRACSRDPHNIRYSTSIPIDPPYPHIPCCRNVLFTGMPFRMTSWLLPPSERYLHSPAFRHG